MFAVIYRWKLVPGREAQFEEGWRAGTEAIAKEFGGWAVAYARWPDRAIWEQAMQSRMHHVAPWCAAIRFDLRLPPRHRQA